jgi:hypothetical protein
VTHRLAHPSVVASALLAVVVLTGASDPGSADEPAPWATEGPTGWIVAGVGVLALLVVAAVLVLARRRARAAPSMEDR